MSDFYILDEHSKPVKVHDSVLWAEWFESDEHRRIAHDKVSDDIVVTTVCLRLFETVVEHNGCCVERWRYPSYAQALEGHELLGITAARLLAIGDDDNKAGA